MPRKLRLEFAGACYHVINRGNYRADIFRSEGARAAFERCLFEACAKSNWVLHAFAVMSNHYHLALETPEANLVAGMQWLQATFANRFNRLRGERGHLFQGRYKALLVEAGGPLGQVCHYIHLNPVRTGIAPAEHLKEYRYSSYWYLGQPKTRPKCLEPRTALSEAGELADTPAGRKKYGDYLAWQAAEGPAGRNKAYVSMSQGWALGTKEFKAALVRDHALVADNRAWESHGAREIREQAWEALFQKAMAALRRKESDLAFGAKSVSWKVAVAIYLKERTQVSNPWLAARLGMKRPVYVSRLVSVARRADKPLPELVILREICKA
jgi:REP element-mobilizing transposase RayT